MHIVDFQIIYYKNIWSVKEIAYINTNASENEFCHIVQVKPWDWFGIMLVTRRLEIFTNKVHGLALNTTPADAITEEAMTAKLRHCITNTKDVIVVLNEENEWIIRQLFPHNPIRIFDGETDISKRQSNPDNHCGKHEINTLRCSKQNVHYMYDNLQVVSLCDDIITLHI